MAKARKPKTRTIYVMEWYDIEGDAGWGEGPDQPPLVVQPCFIISWPRKNQKVRAYRIAGAYAETEAGGSSVIPEGCVKAVTPLKDWEMTYRE